MTRAGSSSPRTAIFAIVIVELLAMSVWFSASAVVPELTREWGLGASGKAWLTSSVQLGFVVGAFSSAVTNVSDRYPAQRVIAIAALAAAACTAAIPLLSIGLQGALVLRFACGVALACVYPPGMKLAASWTRSARGLAIGAVVGALTLGSSLPHLFSAFAQADGSASWRVVLTIAAALAAMAALIAATCLEPGPHLARSAPFDWRHAGKAFTSRPLRLANFGYLGHMWELYAVWTWVPVFLLERFEANGLSATSARLVAFATVAAGGLGSIVAGWGADRIGRTRVAGASLAVSGACCLIAGALGSSPLLLGGVCIIWGFAVVADSAQFSAAASELADSRYVGTALAIQTSAGFLLTLVSIRLVPLITERAGWWPALAILAIGPALGLLSMVALARSPDARRLAGGRG